MKKVLLVMVVVLLAGNVFAQDLRNRVNPVQIPAVAEERVTKINENAARVEFFVYDKDSKEVILGDVVIRLDEILIQTSQISAEIDNLKNATVIQGRIAALEAQKIKLENLKNTILSK